jgi:hypothetical protein
MSVFNTTALALCLAFSAGTALAQDTPAKSAAGAEGAKAVTAQECRELASAKKDGVAKDEAAMKKEAACGDLLRKEDALKSGASSTEPAKK